MSLVRKRDDAGGELWIEHEGTDYDVGGWGREYVDGGVYL